MRTQQQPQLYVAQRFDAPWTTRTVLLVCAFVGFIGCSAESTTNSRLEMSKEGAISNKNLCRGAQGRLEHWVGDDRNLENFDIHSLKALVDDPAVTTVSELWEEMLQTGFLQLGQAGALWRNQGYYGHVPAVAAIYGQLSLQYTDPVAPRFIAANATGDLWVGLKSVENPFVPSSNEPPDFMEVIYFTCDSTTQQAQYRPVIIVENRVAEKSGLTWLEQNEPFPFALPKGFAPTTQPDLPNNQHSVQSVCASCHGQDFHINLWSYPLWPAVIGSNYDDEQRRSRGEQSRAIETALIAKWLEASTSDPTRYRRQTALFDFFRQDIEVGQTLTPENVWLALHNGTLRLDILSNDVEDLRITSSMLRALKKLPKHHTEKMAPLQKLRALADLAPNLIDGENTGTMVDTHDAAAWTTFSTAYCGEMKKAETEKIALHLSALQGAAATVGLPFTNEHSASETQAVRQNQQAMSGTRCKSQAFFFFLVDRLGAWSASPIDTYDWYHFAQPVRSTRSLGPIRLEFRANTYALFAPQYASNWWGTLNQANPGCKSTPTH